jgi:hypothetical protein
MTACNDHWARLREHKVLDDAELTHSCKAGIRLPIKSRGHDPKPLLGKACAPIFLRIGRSICELITSVPPFYPTTGTPARHQDLESWSIVALGQLP